MILVLALVVGAMYLVFMLMRRIARPRQTEDSPIRVMASTSLGAGKSLHLVGLGSKAWLVGSSEQGVNLVAEIDDKELLDGIALDATQSKPSAGGDFGSILTGLLAPKTSRKKSTSTGGRGSAFDVGHLARQRDRLSKFRGDEK
jgi:flagellar protein FliO/FliZ